MATTLAAATKFTAVDRFSGKVSKMSAATRRFSATARSSFARAQRSVRAVSRSANNLFNKLISLRSAAGVMIGAMAVKRVYDMASGIAAAGDEASKSARMMDMTAESLQELRFAAERQGVSTKLMDKSFLALNKRMGELRAGSGQLYSYLSKTGQGALIDQLKTADNSQQAFMMLTKRMKEVENPMDRAALANAAFSRSGIEMVKMMELGADGIKKLMANAREYGFIISNETAKKSEKYMDVQTNMNKTLEGMKVLLAVELMPKIQKLSVQLTNWILKNKDLIKTKVSAFVEKLANVLRFLKKHLSKIIKVVKIYIGLLLLLKTVSFLSAIATAALKIAQFGYTAAVWLAVAAQWAYNVAMAAGLLPILAIVAAVAAVIAVVAIIIKKWNDWGAAVAIFLGPLGFVISLIQSFRRNWDMVKEAFKTGGILEGFKAIGKVILDAVLQPIQQLLELIAKIPGAAKLVQPAIDKMQQYREGLGVNTTTDEQGNPINQPEAQTQNQKVEIGVKADPGTQAKENSNTGIPINIGNTIGWQPAGVSW